MGEKVSRRKGMFGEIEGEEEWLFGPHAHAHSRILSPAPRTHLDELSDAFRPRAEQNRALFCHGRVSSPAAIAGSRVILQELLPRTLHPLNFF